nr:cation:dicarboxylase symporter family transporter [Idiomarina sp. ATCH4]
MGLVLKLVANFTVPLCATVHLAGSTITIVSGAVMSAVGLLGSMLGFGETAVALMIALYMAQDSFGTACNITGDGAIAMFVDSSKESEQTTN